MKRLFSLLPVLFILFYHCTVVQASTFHVQDTTKVAPKTKPQQAVDTMRVSICKGIEKFYLYRYDSVNMVRSLDSLIIYNPVIKRFNINTSLGNTGSSYFSPFYKHDRSLGFKAEMGSRRMFLWQSSDIRFVNSQKRYTRIYYVNGSNKENYIEVEHSQSFGKNLDIGFRYNRINSLGYYTSQQTYYSRLNLYGRLSSRNQRYFLLINGALNSNKNQDNGGLVNDEQFENDSISNLKFLDVNLNGAQSQIKDNSFMVHQHYDFGRKVKREKSAEEMPGDSVTVVDSVITPQPEQVFIPWFRIGHEVSFRKNFFLYNHPDPRSEFYSAINLDSLATHDSVGVKNLENSVSFTIFAGRQRSGNYFAKNYLGGTIRHQYTQLAYGGIVPDTGTTHIFKETFSYNNNNIFIDGNAGINGRIINKMWVDVAFCLAGYNIGDFSGLFGLQKFLGDSTGNSERIEASASMSNRMPDYITQNYISNHFVWTNNFSKVYNMSVEGAFVSPRWKLKAGAGYNLVNNLVYFSQDATPAQYGKAFTIIKAFVQKKFTVGKFNLDNDVTYQYVKQSLPLRLPAVVLRSSFYFESMIFKKKLQSRFGVDLYYNTAWNSYTYMPSTGQFYLQDTKKTGNYPYLDVYAAFRVKGARFFFKLDHAFAGLLGNTYYGAAHYPLNGRTFKFGVDWSFLD